MKIEKMSNATSKEHAFLTYWMIVENSSNDLAGMIGFKGLLEDKSAEVGYGINPGAEKKGFATEALQGIANWAFKDPRCKKITATQVLKENIGSQKVLEKNGFEKISQTDKGIDYVLVKKEKDVF